jgi:heme-degrading monooxygenase HmoA
MSIPIKRIVKMNFRDDAREEFIEIFNHTKSLIRDFPGCNHVELLMLSNSPSTMFTLSYWEDESYLEEYRKSDLFKTTWAKTKILFAEKAEAWSMVSISKNENEL